MEKPKKTIGDPLIKGSCHANPLYIKWANAEIAEAVNLLDILIQTTDTLHLTHKFADEFLDDIRDFITKHETGT